MPTGSACLTDTSSTFDASFDVCVCVCRAPLLVEDGHSETESEAAVDKLDKEYWIRRAGEVGISSYSLCDYECVSRDSYQCSCNRAVSTGHRR